MRIIKQMACGIVGMAYDLSLKIVSFDQLRLAGDDAAAASVAYSILDFLRFMKEEDSMRDIYDAFIREYAIELKSVVTYYKEHKES